MKQDLTGLSPELLHKYNVQGPRYTSYPPAPSWSAELGGEDYEKAIRRSQETDSPRPLSLYFHIPFCEELCYFCACMTIITGRNHALERPYLRTIGKEVDWLAARISPERPVVQFHLGGGTPTYMSPDNMDRFLSHIKRSFHFDPSSENGVEIDPRVTTEEHLTVLRKHGFNRLSIGVQDFNPQVQKVVNRIQSFDDTKIMMDKARAMGFDSINIDLIYGMPHQTAKSFETTIAQIVSLNPDRLAVYSFAYVPWMKKYQETLARLMPSEQEKYKIFITALKGLTQVGYDYIGLDHFAKPTDELSRARQDRTLWRNFQGYTTKAGTDLLGIGMTAISQVNHSYFQNQKALRDYEGCIESGHPATARGFCLSLEDKIRSRIIQNLLCHAVIVKSEIEKEFDIDFDSTFSAALRDLAQMEADGLVVLDKNTIEPTALGRVFLRNMAMPFDAYLPKTGETRVFSRTL